MRPIGQKPHCLVAFRHIFGFSLSFKPKTRLLTALPLCPQRFSPFWTILPLFALFLAVLRLFCQFEGFYGFSPLFGAFKPIRRLFTPFSALFKLFAHFCYCLQQNPHSAAICALCSQFRGCLEAFRLLAAVCLHFGPNAFILRFTPAIGLFYADSPLFATSRPHFTQNTAFEPLRAVLSRFEASSRGFTHISPNSRSNPALRAKIIVFPCPHALFCLFRDIICCFLSQFACPVHSTLLTRISLTFQPTNPAFTTLSPKKPAIWLDFQSILPAWHPVSFNSLTLLKSSPLPSLLTP